MHRTSDSAHAGFLDLPWELRHQVYEHHLPTKRLIHFPESPRSNEEKPLLALLSAIKPLFKTELEDLIFKHCKPHIKVTPSERMGLPDLDWYRFRRITIEIAYPSDGQRTDGWDGMTELVESLTHGSPERLREIEIMFLQQSGDCETTLRGGDIMWTEDVPARSEFTSGTFKPGEDDPFIPGGSYYQYLPNRGADIFDDTDHNSDCDSSECCHIVFDPWAVDQWLRAAEDFYKNPLAIEILDHFLELPICDLVVVHEIYGLHFRRPNQPRYDEVGKVFDFDYMADLFAALKFWLEGDRIALTKERRGINGEPRLERLAYHLSMSSKGRYYCTQHGREKL